MYMYVLICFCLGREILVEESLLARGGALGQVLVRLAPGLASHQ
jgi:hypothetical protein